MMGGVPRFRRALLAGWMLIAGVIAVTLSSISAPFVQATSSPVRVSPLALAEDAGCAVRADSSVVCWGSGPLGGDYTGPFSNGPVVVEGVTGARSVDISASHGCASLDNGRVQCWGRNTRGALGDGTRDNSTLPTIVLPLVRDAEEVVVGGDFSCARTVGGIVWCWGTNASGELASESHFSSTAPVQISGATNVVDIGVGEAFGCVLTSAGSVKCWGQYDRVSGGLYPTYPTQAVPIAGLGTVKELAVGGVFTCVLLTDSTVKCWGQNSSGVLGYVGQPFIEPSPVSIPGLDDVVSISAGRSHACAVHTDGSASCWGQIRYVSSGGFPTGISSSTPHAVRTSGPVERIVSGGNGACAFLVSGDVECWGENKLGQLGPGQAEFSSTPRAATGLAGVASLGTQCAAMAEGAVRCWGDAGRVLEDSPNYGDVELPGISDAVTADGNDYYGCARRTGGVVSCWGRPAYLPPTVIDDLADVTEVRSAGYWACALDEGGAGDCWVGPNGSIVPIADFTDIVSVTAESNRRCAVRSDGTAWCTPSQYSETFELVDSIDDAAEITMGSGIDCALLIDGGVTCWPTLPAWMEPLPIEPQVVPGIAGAIGVSAGDNFACALLAEGTVWCWGDNSWGALGDGTLTDSATPVQAEGISDAIGLRASGGSVCALSATGQVWCWGRNVHGELGVSYEVFDPIPAPEFGGLRAPSVVAPLPKDLIATTPVRVLDTRSGYTTSDGQYAGIGYRAAASTTSVVVAGRLNVPAGAEAVILNVTFTANAGPGFVTAFPCGSPLPNSTTANFSAPGQTKPNMAIIKVGAGGAICLYTKAATHLIVDVSGYVPAGAGYAPLVPMRLLETRPGFSTFDGQYAGIGRPAAQSVVELQVTGRAGIDDDASSVVLNLTSTGNVGPGYIVVFPCGSPMPVTSSLNYTRPGETVGNAVVAKIGDDGKICLFTHSAANLIVDVSGFFPRFTTFVPLLPVRVMETRPGYVDSEGRPGFAPWQRMTSNPLGRFGTYVPKGAAGVIANVTCTGNAGPGFVTAYPNGTARPATANVTYSGTGQTVANLVVVGLGTFDEAMVYTESTVHGIVDLGGYFT